MAPASPPTAPMPASPARWPAGLAVSRVIGGVVVALAHQSAALPSVPHGRFAAVHKLARQGGEA